MNEFTLTVNLITIILICIGLLMAWGRKNRYPKWGLADRTVLCDITFFYLFIPLGIANMPDCFPHALAIENIVNNAVDVILRRQLVIRGTGLTLFLAAVVLYLLSVFLLKKVKWFFVPENLLPGVIFLSLGIAMQYPLILGLSVLHLLLGTAIILTERKAWKREK